MQNIRMLYLYAKNVRGCLPLAFFPEIPFYQSFSTVTSLK